MPSISKLFRLFSSNTCFLISVLLAAITSTLSAQTPQEIRLIETNIGTLRSCIDHYAGTWRRGTFLGRSNDIQNVTMYFCFGDQLQILGNNDADLSGDPIPATAPGVGYAFYSCLPTISGPDLASIISDPCVATAPPPAPPPAGGIYVDAMGSPNGDRLFSNNGTLQSFFNFGNPVSLWFTPITIDDFATQGYENGGPCVNSNINAAFNIVYLNPVELSDFRGDQVNPLRGMVRINGGLPQFATNGPGRFYNNIEIVLSTNPSIRGTIVNGSNFSHGDEIEFIVPQAGNYIIRVTDQKSCPGELLVTLPQTDVVISLTQVEVDPGITTCVEISVDNFENVTSFQFAVNWDPTIVRYQSFNNPNVIPGLLINPIGQNGEFRVIWENPIPLTLADGTVILEICFEAIGNPGDSSYVDIRDITIPTEVISNDVVANTQIRGGGIKIRIPTNLTVYSRSCSTLGNTGSITFAAVGGAPPYNYRLEKSDGTVIRNGIINNPGEWRTENNLPWGRYSIDVRDANNTLVIHPDSVHRAEAMFVNLNITNPLCFGDANGRISLNQFGGGAGPYTVQWSTGQFGGQEIRRLPAGNYAVTLIDQFGCTATASTTLGVTRVTASFTTSRPSCSGVNDGSILAFPSGGTPGLPPNQSYTFLWSNQGTTQTISDVGSGCYQVTIVDGNGCRFEDQVCLDPIKTLDIETTVTLPTCHRSNDAQILIRAFQNGGTDALPYIFNWSSGTVTSIPPDQSRLTNLQGNSSYTVTITDLEGCNIIRTIDVAERPPLNVFLIELRNVSCGGNGMDGSLQVSGTGGTFIYNYAWSNGQNSGTISNLAPGTYTVTVSDSNGCSVSSSFVIQQEGPDFTLSSTPVTCPGGNNGTATAQITFAGSTSIRWSTGATTNMISNLSAGWYYITVSATINGVQCDRIDSIQVLQPDPITVVENHTPPSCPGSMDGIIELLVSGGTGNYTFQWTHSPLSTNRLENQRGGQSYTVTIRDDSGCPPLVYSFIMPSRDLIRFRFSQLLGVSCPTSACDGSVFLELQDGAVPNGTFRIDWPSGQTINGVRSHTLTGLCAGLNVITVTDQNGCVQTSSVTVPSPVPISINANNSIINDVSCNGLADGSALIAANGGTGPYTVFWPQLNITGPSVDNLPTGQYSLRITDSRDCFLDTFIVINEPPVLVVTLDTNQVSLIGCSGVNDGQIGIEVSGGNPGPLRYDWSANVSNGPVASGLGAGTYTVTVTDIKNCTATFAYTLNEPEPIIAVIPTPEPPRCFGEMTFITVTSASGGSGSGYNFSVDNGPLTPIGGSVPAGAGSRLVRVFDGKGCSFETTVVIDGPDQILISVNEIIEIDLGDTIQLNPIIVSEFPITTYQWTPSTALSCIDCPNPSAFPSNSTNYTLIVTDSNGCTASAQIRVTVSKRRYVFIPDAFTPNADGINDIFSVFTGKGVKSINFLRVYNRWGAQIFEALDIDPENSGQIGWDGRFKGDMMEPGVYIYTAQVSFIDGAVLLYRGDITLLR